MKAQHRGTVPFVHLAYDNPRDQKGASLALARGRWDGRTVTGVTDLVAAQDASCVSRTVFGHELVVNRES